MGLIFDIRTAKLYENWCQSPKGRAMDKWMESAIPTLLSPRSDERVLDIGCGHGNNLLFFNKLGLDITGIDASPYMIDRAKERLGHRCTLKQGTASDLPFEDNDFDLVIMINTLEFLDSPMEALREAGRVARRSVFVGALNSFSCYSQRNRIQGLFVKSLFKHARLYNLWELKSQVRSAYGDVPMAWRCSQLWPALLGESLGQRVAEHRALNHFPFGPFLALSADIQYLLRTEGHPLKVRLKKAGHSVADGLTMDKGASVKRKGVKESRIQGFKGKNRENAQGI
ncbi:class I SAM-dependent methyltransferase [Thermodesulfobacteriota bacterium]